MELFKSTMHFSTSPSNISSIFMLYLHLLIISLDILCNNYDILSAVLKCSEFSQIYLTLYNKPSNNSGISFGFAASNYLHGSYRIFNLSKLFSANIEPVLIFSVTSLND